MDPAVFHINNTQEIRMVFNHPLTYQVSKDLFALDGMTAFEQVDPLTLVWTVRPGMTFHNGDPMGAEEWAFSVNRVLSIAADLGGSTHPPPPSYSYIDTVDAPDELTATEHWLRPVAGGPVDRSQHYYSWVNPRIVETHGIDGQIQELPFGSGGGPYTLERRDAQGTQIVRWGGYYTHPNPDDGFVEDGPYIQEQVVSIIPDRAAIKAAFLSGDLDVFGSIDEFEVDEFQNAGHVDVLEVPTGNISLQGMDGGKFYDVRARQALQRAFDYEGFINAVRGGNGFYETPLSHLFTALQRLSQEELVSRWLHHDPAEARKLWEAAAPPIDKMTILISAGDPLVTDIHDFAAQSYKNALGVDTAVEVVDANTWAARAIDQSTNVKDWELLGYGSGVGGGVTSPAVSSLVHFDPRGYGKNAFNFHFDSPHQSILEGSEVVAKLMEDQAAETDVEARAAIITELQTYILDNQWCNFALPGAKTSFFAVHNRLRDWAPDDWNNNGYAHRRHSMWLADA